ncbi:MAG: four helix bundle protein [Parcubacteria group bacterium]
MNEYQLKLKGLMDEYVHYIYQITARFPKEELYGTISQFRRAGLSIILNYIEGYAIRRTLVRFNQLETSYGSLQETRYLWDFSVAEHYTNDEEYKKGIKLAEEIGAMLWTELSNPEKTI